MTARTGTWRAGHPGDESDPVTGGAAGGTEPLWPHQREAVDAVLAEFERTDRALLPMACGTGKTRVGAEIARRLAQRVPGPFLITVPTLRLLDQTVAAWARALGRPALGRIVAVCSKPGIVARYHNRLRGWEAAVTSEPDVLADLLRGGPTTVLSTYQSLDVLLSAYRRHSLPAVALALIDEAHRTAGSVGRPWSAVHDEIRLPARYRLSMTATPKVFLGGDDVISLDDETRVGRAVYSLPYGLARDRGLVAHFRMVVPLVTDADVASVVTAVENPAYYATGGTPVTARMLATQIALLRAAHQYGVRRMITYHGTVADAELFSRTLSLALQHLEPHERPSSLWAGHVHGGHAPAVRDAVLGRLSEPHHGLVVVANARLLSEGVDVPETDAVAILSPRSAIATGQIIGRAVRQQPGRFKVATVFVPANPEDGVDLADGADSPGFATVFSTARAMAATDDTLAAHTAASRRALGAAESIPPRPEQPDWLTVTGTSVPEGFARAILVRVVRETSASWHEYLGAADRFLAEGGSLADVPRNWRSPEGLAFGAWWHATHQAFTEDRVPADLREALEEVGMTKRLATAVWDTFVADLTAYRDEHGHVDVPVSHVNGAGRRLGAQVRRARDRLDRYSDAQRSQLTALGFTPNVLDAVWDTFVADLTAYRDEHGHVDVKRDHITAEGRKLGIQVGSHRETFDALPPERQAQLTALGFTPNVFDAVWDTFVADLTAYRDEYGHLDVPTDYVNAAGRPLGRKASRHRGNRWNILPAKRQAQLSTLGFTRSLLDARWSRHAAAWAAHAEESGTTMVAKAYVTPDGVNLSQWRQRQLKRLHAGKLPPHQVETLVRLGLIDPPTGAPPYDATDRSTDQGTHNPGHTGEVPR
ncbi:Helicase associated domain protein [Kitasatospora purpeofusca]|uniref:DEAD/DEAH box helicase n=1 Tax=Kitasatospora purpeofusca TaxID=67352 RepID=UPI00369E7FB1